ncbi:MAG: DNA primase [Candidatus Kaiserbacteria bacterium]|nr:DNA primase [Candidatus Kaiserbacteria bacterium]
MDTVRQIKDKLSITDVVSQYVKLERAGSTLRARCPFHSERTPSFFVSPERGTYHCFGCNVGGDIFSFIEQIEGLDFKGALKILAEKAGVPLVYEKRGERDSRERLFELLETATIFYASHLNDSAREYLHERGVSDETIKSFRVGFAVDAWGEASDYLRSKGFSEKEILDTGLAKRGERGLYDRFRSRIIFPIADSAGRIVGFSGRILPAREGAGASPAKSDIEPPKYLNSPETELFHKSRILYAYDRAKQAMRKNNCAVLVEGQLDLISSHQAGWVNTVAVSGTAFTPEHAVLISRMTENLVIALDADEAGIKAAGRAARAALRAGLNVKVARLPEGKDPADLILESGKEAWTSAIRESKDVILFLLDVLHLHTQGAGKGALEKDRFRKAVEAIVLPFLADVQSPIARDQYVREIAGRLGVSEKAVQESLLNVPRDASLDIAPSNTKPVFAERYGRAKQAFSILLWQESCEKPELDVASYIKEFEEAIGTDAYKILRSLPESEQESLRFSAEGLYGKSAGFKREAKTLLDILLRDRLSDELANVTSALKTAEAEGNESLAEETMRLCKLLTTKIAQLPR